jgi:hypothetical protein
MRRAAQFPRRWVPPTEKKFRVRQMVSILARREGWAQRQYRGVKGRIKTGVSGERWDWDE